MKVFDQYIGRLKVINRFRNKCLGNTYPVFALPSLSIPAVLRHEPLQVHQADHPDKLLLFFREGIKRFF